MKQDLVQLRWWAISFTPSKRNLIGTMHTAESWRWSTEVESPLQLRSHCASEEEDTYFKKNVVRKALVYQSPMVKVMYSSKVITASQSSQAVNKSERQSFQLPFLYSIIKGFCILVLRTLFMGQRLKTWSYPPKGNGGDRCLVRFSQGRLLLGY